MFLFIKVLFAYVFAFDTTPVLSTRDISYLEKIIGTLCAGMCRVTCAHCHDTFLFNTLNNALARCPHCRYVQKHALNN